MSRRGQKVTLDSAGVREILNSGGIRQAVHDAAQRVRSGVPLDVRVDVADYTTDRAASAVTIVDPRGRLMEVRDGVLSNAALRAGLELGDQGLIDYTTKDGRTRKATRAQVANWTRGRP